MTPPAPLLLPTADEALAWVRARTPTGLDRARELVDRLRERAAGRVARGRAAPVGRGDAGAQQRRRARRRCFSNVHPRARGAHRVRGGRARGRQAGHRAAPGPRALRRVRRARRRPGSTRPAARLLEKMLEDFRRAGVDQDDATRARLAEISERITDARPGVQPQHPRRRPHRPGHARAAGRHAGGLAGARTRPTTTGWSRSRPTTPTRSRRGCSSHDADVRRAVTVAFLERGWPAERAAAAGSCSTCATSTPTWSATPTGRRTTPR